MNQALGGICTTCPNTDYDRRTTIWENLKGACMKEKNYPAFSFKFFSNVSVSYVTNMEAFKVLRQWFQVSVENFFLISGYQNMMTSQQRCSFQTEMYSLEVNNKYPNK